MSFYFMACQATQRRYIKEALCLGYIVSFILFSSTDTTWSETGALGLPLSLVLSQQANMNMPKARPQAAENPPKKIG